MQELRRRVCIAFWRATRILFDVEVALSSSAEIETDYEDESTNGRPIADRIDFAALQRKGDEARIVFFEAKRFENRELRSRTEPRVIEQIGKYETFITKYKEEIKLSYRRICDNLTKLVPDRCDPLVFQGADGSLKLAVDPDVRLVVFGYDADQKVGPELAWQTWTAG